MGPRTGVSQTGAACPACQPFWNREPGSCPPSAWPALKAEYQVWGGPPWNCALPWPTGESRIHPGPGCGLRAVPSCQLPAESPSLEGLPRGPHGMGLSTGSPSLERGRALEQAGEGEMEAEGSG